MKHIPEHLAKFLHNTTFFAEMPEETVAAFMAAGRVQEYRKQESIVLRGDRANRFFIVMSGWVKLHRETPYGTESVVAMLSRGDAIGEMAIFDDTEYSFSAEAVCETKIIEISSATLKEKGADPQILLGIMASLSRSVRRVQIEAEHLSLMNAPRRLACLLLKLSTDMIGKGGSFTLPYDKSLAAAQLGMTPETFSRALAQLKPLGVRVHATEVNIEQFQDLGKFCCSSCSATPKECRGCRAPAIEEFRKIA